MNVPVWLWLVTIAGLGAVVLADLLVVDRRPHAVTTAEATRWVALYLALAVTFGVGLWLLAGSTPAGEFFAGDRRDRVQGEQQVGGSDGGHHDQHRRHPALAVDPHRDVGAVIPVGHRVKLVLEALHENELPFLNGGEPVVDFQLGTATSLGVIGGVLAITTVVSLVRARQLAGRARRSERDPVGVGD